MAKDTTKLRRALLGLGVAVAAVIAVVVIGRLSNPSVLHEPADTLIDLNAAAAGIDAVAAWDSTGTEPRLLRVTVNPFDPAARIVTARLGAGDVVQIAVVADPATGRWQPQGRPQPAGDPAELDRATTPLLETGLPRRGDPTFDAVSAAQRWLVAHLTGDVSLADIIASPQFAPPEPSLIFDSVEVTGATAPVEFPEAGIAFFGLDFRTDDSDQGQREWRSWVAVRHAGGSEWLVEGFYPLRPAR